MIDVESKIFSIIAEQTRAKFPNIFITGEYVASPPSFPCVSLVEVDNAIFRKTLTQENRENHAAVLYEVNVYSNKKVGHKSECKAIAGFIDERLQDMSFTRMFMNPIPNFEDSTIYRMVGRYRAVISKEKVIYRR